jgi:hypothetical protein
MKLFNQTGEICPVCLKPISRREILGRKLYFAVGVLISIMLTLFAGSCYYHWVLQEAINPK